MTESINDNLELYRQLEGVLQPLKGGDLLVDEQIDSCLQYYKEQAVNVTSPDDERGRDDWGTFRQLVPERAKGARMMIFQNAGIRSMGAPGRYETIQKGDPRYPAYKVGQNIVASVQELLSRR